MRDRRTRFAVLLALVALLLTACGARIDTTLNLDAEGSGSRVMTLTLSDDEDMLVGGVEAVDASIQRHIPDGIEYSGLDRNADGHLVTTFTVPFSSPEDYRSTMAEILRAGDLPWAEENAFSIVQSEFVQGVHVEESFTSADVLAWLFAGLLADGVVEEDNSSNMWELGDTVVSFDGIDHERSAQIEFSEVTDNGFANVSFDTEVRADGFDRVISYHLADKARYNTAPELYDGYFADLTDQGFDVETDSASTGMTWTVGFSAAEPAELVARTNAALSSEEAAFAVETTADPDAPTTLVTTVTEFAECAEICSPAAGPVTDSVTVAAADGDGLRMELTEGGATGSVTRSVAFTSAVAQLAVAGDGAIEWVGEFTVPREDAELLGDGLADLLGSAGKADVTSDTDDTSAVYTVSLSGADSSSFAAAYQAWSDSEDAYLVHAEQEGSSFFKRHYAVAGMLPLGHLSAALPSEGVDLTVSLPGGDSFVTDEMAYYLPADAVLDDSKATFRAFEGTEFNFQATGVPLSAWIFYGVLAALLVGIAVALVVLRRPIAARIARRRTGVTTQPSAPYAPPADRQPGPSPQGPGAP